MKNIHYKWEQFDQDVKIIAGAISSSFPVEKIYGIERGGSFLAVCLSYILNKKVEIISPDYKITDNKNVLIVDDICDSGSTFEKITNNVKSYRTVSIYYNIKQNYSVDYFARKIDRDYEKSWIVFPWEMNT